MAMFFEKKHTLLTRNKNESFDRKKSLFSNTEEIVNYICQNFADKNNANIILIPEIIRQKLKVALEISNGL